MTRERLGEILSGIKKARVGIYGDLCLDVYWYADMRMSELSRETPHFAMPIVAEHLFLGGGGNVAANLAALKPGVVYAAGTAGVDWRGRELTRLMEEAGIKTEHIVTRPALVTNAFCKPMRRGISDRVYEDPRLDFANIAPLGDEVEKSLIESLTQVAAQVDVLCIADQLPTNVSGAVTNRIRAHILTLAEQGLTIIVDSRDRIGLYKGKGIILKPNEMEAARAVNATFTETVNTADFEKIAQALAQDNREVVMTIGEKGSIVATKNSATHIPARSVTGEIDIVGAGDAFIAGFATATAAGATRQEAAFFAGLCSEVTIQKIGTTGTASPEEITARYDFTHKEEKP